MTAAQKAMQANQWSETLKNLEAAEAKIRLTAYDKTKIAEFKGILLCEAEQSQGGADRLRGGAGGRRLYAGRDCRRPIACCFNWPRHNKQNAKAIEYGKQATEAGVGHATMTC